MRMRRAKTYTEGARDGAHAMRPSTSEARRGGGGSRGAAQRRKTASWIPLVSDTARRKSVAAWVPQRGEPAEGQEQTTEATCAALGRRSLLAPDVVERAVLLAEYFEAERGASASTRKRHALRGDDAGTMAAKAAAMRFWRARLGAWCRASWRSGSTEFLWCFSIEMAWNVPLVVLASLVRPLESAALVRAALPLVDWSVHITWGLLQCGGVANLAGLALSVGLGVARPLTILAPAVAGVLAVIAARWLQAAAGLLPLPSPRDEWRFVALPPVWTPHEEFDGYLCFEVLYGLWAIFTYSAVFWVKDTFSQRLQRALVPAIIVAGLYEGGFRNPTQVLADACFRRDVPLRVVRAALVCLGAYVTGCWHRPEPEADDEDDDEPEEDQDEEEEDKPKAS